MTVTLHLTAGAGAETTATALGLAERLFSRGHRVTVFAAREAVALAAGDDDIARGIAALLRKGVHGPTLQWVVDGAAARRRGVEGRLVPGVVAGDLSDLWSFVRDADVVLSPPGER